MSMAESDKKYSSNTFLRGFTISALIVFLFVGLLSFIVDPFLQYRVDYDNKYMLNPRLVNGGLAKNYEYNTVVMGSSMVQGFDVSILRDNYPHTRPVKLSSGGMNIDEMEYLYSFVKVDSVDNFIINIDMPPFNQYGIGVRYPKHLYEDGVMNKLQYLYGYETLINYIPVDIALGFYLKDEKRMTPIYRMKTNLDVIGSENYDKVFSKEAAIHDYLYGVRVSTMVLDSMEYRMKNRLDKFLDHLEISNHTNTRYTFLFPSYSALYWYHSRINGFYDQFNNFLRYFNTSVQKYDNVRIAFFSDIDEITDLNHYRDLTHFGPSLSDMILENIYNTKYELKSSNIEEKIQRMDSLINIFVQENKDWLPTTYNEDE